MDPLFCLIHKNHGSPYPLGLNAVTIYEDGEVLPTSRLPVSLGNIKRDTLEQIWTSNSDLHDLRDARSEACRKCDYFSQCGGGNLEVSISYFGNLDHVDPQCWHYHEKLEKDKFNHLFAQSINQSRYVFWQK
ncbi:MAG: SPASM domain-containing protein [Bdellovibrionota bacterium]